MQSDHAAGAPRLVVTGASGYIGRRLVRMASERGFDVVATVRDPACAAPLAGVSFRAFDLTGGDEPDGWLAGTDAVIHLAAIIADDSRPAGAVEDLNVSGSRRLLRAARRADVTRFVFLSSQSAAREAPTRYGRSKWEIEQLLTQPGECAVRTGLVSGGPPRGLYGTLYRLARRSALLPIIRPAAPVYPLHVDDLCDGLLRLAVSPEDPPRLMRLAAAEAMRFGDYVRLLARERLGRRVRLLPVPARPLLALSRLTERVPLLPTVSSERVLGLMALRRMDADSLPAPPGAAGPRDVAAALGDEGRRRRLLAEGRALTRYVLGCEVPGAVWRRYARALETSGDLEPLGLSAAVAAWPPLLRLAEPVGGETSDLRRRLALATRIVEMTTGGAAVFHQYRERPRALAWMALGWIVATEALLLPVRWLATRLGGRR